MAAGLSLRRALDSTGKTLARQHGPNDLYEPHWQCPDSNGLFDDQRINGGSSAIHDLQRCSGVEERVLVVSGAVCSKGRKIDDFCEGDSEVPH